MRLYLSSFRLGCCPERLLELTRQGRRAAVIANAADVHPPERRSEAVAYELQALREIGFEASEFDLRTHFNESPQSARALLDELGSFDLLWVRGGDVFTLRYSMKRSGADTVLLQLLADDAIAYGGYSAGVCVLSPSLRGLETVDDPGWLRSLYGSEPVWDGLSVLEYRVVPHVDSPGHPESQRCDRLASEYQAAGVRHRALRDGDVIVVDGDGERWCPRSTGNMSSSPPA